MDFFREFSFEEAMRRPSSIHEAERAAMNVSPTSIHIAPLPTRLPTPPPCSIGDLAYRFHQQSLRVDTSVPPCYAYAPLTPPSDDDSASSADFPSSLSSSQLSSYESMSPAELRMRRQANTRMQCDASHVKDITNLVKKMIEDGDQCHICDPKSRTSSRASSSSSADEDEDEGVDMDYIPPSDQDLPLYSVKFRRSGDRVVGHAAVMKSVRMRKKPKMLKRLSSK
ncbi:hypothetical protein BDV96DRAFT_588884 [Lophiotrema nucula]|uniref:Uncharacterized protein n=1 Tax=Lophiotrema nucula TaxID=690887 RepID=A0A6A5YJV6_9PLEO|nr:hypothetical protein BDV96DRAFT_588884 [Lophiotrema nucula]